LALCEGQIVPPALPAPLPRYTNIRRVFVDNSTTPPTFWIGNNHGAAIIKVEPLD
jgi:virginiamycin B lyase